MPVSSQTFIPHDVVLFEEDEFIICGASVNFDFVMQALAGNLGLHTFKWEHIAGPPADLVINTPLRNSANLNFDVINSSFFDRTFRFTINERTIRELTFDVTAYRTPTSFTYANNAGSGGAGRIGQVLGEYSNTNPRGRNPVATGLRFFPPTFNTTGQAGCTGTLWALSWTEPEQPQLLSRYLVQQLVGAVFVDIATFLPTQPRTYFGVVDQGIYRVVAEYNNALLTDNVGSILSLHPSQAVYLNALSTLEGSPNIEGSSATMGSSFAGAINSVNVLNYTTTFITVEGCDNFTDIPDTNSGAFSNKADGVRVVDYSALALTLDFCDNFTDIPDTNSGAFSNTANAIRVLTYTVLALGGGSIGG